MWLCGKFVKCVREIVTWNTTTAMAAKKMNVESNDERVLVPHTIDQTMDVCKHNRYIYADRELIYIYDDTTYIYFRSSHLMSWHRIDGEMFDEHEHNAQYYNYYYIYLSILCMRYGDPSTETKTQNKNVIFRPDSDVSEMCHFTTSSTQPNQQQYRKQIQFSAVE